MRSRPRLALALVALLAAPGAGWTAAWAASPPRSAPALTGRWFGMDGRMLHTWEFTVDGAFLHQTAVSGAGTSLRTSERGRYQHEHDEVVLRVERNASGFATPGVGGRTVQLGGGAGAAPEVRRLALRRAPGGAVLLGGVRLKPKSW